MIRSTLAILVLAAVLTGCGVDEPVRIGFIGTLTGRNADLGIDGRNGVLLAVEQRNQAGGVNGRKVELLIRDDAQNSETAVKATRELLAERVDVIVGPMISVVAEAVLPVTETAGVTMISPTVMSPKLTGRDDLFFRINTIPRKNAQLYAETLYRRQGLRRVAVAYDQHNRGYTETWLAAFRADFTALGGEVLVALPFQTSADAGFAEIVRALLEVKPDGLLFIAGAVDTARLSQQAHKQAPNLPRAAADWAASEQLLELGGIAVEGLIIAQIHNRDDASPRYTAFRAAFRARFRQEPGMASVAAYDATTVALDALSHRASGQSLKESLLTGSFTGLQQTITFDRFGDTQRQAFMTVIRDGRFVLLE